MFIFPGFNSNIEHRNRNYHIQTEVNSVNNKYKVNTLIYLAGTIYYSESSELTPEEYINRETAVLTIRKQHNKIIRNLISDQLEAQKNSPEEGIPNFAGLYKNTDFFSCNGNCFTNTRETYRKLIMHEENRIKENE